MPDHLRPHAAKPEWAHFKPTTHDMHAGNGFSDYGVIRRIMHLEVADACEVAHDVPAAILGRTRSGLRAFR